MLKLAFEFKRQLTKDMITIVLFFSYFIDLQLRNKVEIRLAIEPPIYRSKYPNRRHTDTRCCEILMCGVFCSYSNEGCSLICMNSAPGNNNYNYFS